MRILCVFLIISLVFSCKKTESSYAVTINCNAKIKASSKNGYTKNYYANSVHLESIGHYENGIQQGFWKYLYQNGNTKAEGHYEKGQKQGYWKEYYKNNNLKSEGHIDHCKPSGYWKFYDKQKKLIKEINY